jgi:hypothetical protein
VNDQNLILVTSAVDASSMYTVDHQTLVATAFKSSSPWKTADLANSNILQTRKPVTPPDLIASKAATLNDNIQLYPNPVTSNQFNIQFSMLDAGTYSVQVTDARGQQVAHRNVTLGGKGATVANITLPSSASKGIYIVKVNDPASRTVYSNKIAVQ